MRPAKGNVTTDDGVRLWIEARDNVFEPISTFLDGQWPDAVERVESLDPAGPKP